MTKLYITHPELNFGLVNKNSVLLTSVPRFLTKQEYHTSIGDLAATELVSLIDRFDEIEFVSAKFQENDSITKETVLFLNYVRSRKPVRNFNDTNCITFTDHPAIDSREQLPTLWVFGCSRSYGTGLLDSEETYGAILARELDMPLKLVARPASSTQWSFRHLLTANLRVGDLVIWQLSDAGRISYFNGKHTNDIGLARTDDAHILEVFTDEQIFFNHLSCLNAGVKYLRLLGVNFMFISPGANNTLTYEYLKYPEYYHNDTFLVDLGTDQLHPGPLSHKSLAKSILDRVHLLNV